MNKKWKIIKSRIIHKNPWWKLRKDNFKYHNGNNGVYYIVETGHSVFVVPVKDDKIIFIKQYRHPVKRKMLELPNGGIQKGKSSLKSAKEELREEAGYKSKLIKKIGSYAVMSGLSTEECFVYLAESLEFIGEEREESEVESGMEIVEIGIDKAYEMLDNGKIFCGQTVVALTLARKYLMK